jgi:CBS domain-containing protein
LRVFHETIKGGDSNSGLEHEKEEEQMNIKHVLSNKGGDVITVESTARVEQAVALLEEKRIGAVPVVDHGSVRGIFSERDVIHVLAQNGQAGLQRLVGDVMTSPAVTVDLDTPVLSALSLMTRRRIRHLPVLDKGNLVGFVSIGDLVKHRIDQIEYEAASMRDYIQTA